MALLAGPVIHDDPATAVAMALRSLQPALEPEHIEVVNVYCPRALPGNIPTWGWELAPGAPAVKDQTIATIEGIEQDGHWRPTGPANHPAVERGVVVELDEEWVVAAAADDGESNGDLAEQAMNHYADMTGD
jgi:hypothetical protein